METPVYRGNVRLGSGVGMHLRQRIRKAQRSIHVLSPYLSHSFVADLVAAQKRGVDVHLLTSDSESLITSLQQKELYRQVLRRRLVRDERRAAAKAAGLLLSAAVLLGSLAAAYLYSYWLLIPATLALMAIGVLLRVHTSQALYEPLLGSFTVFCSQEGVLPAASVGARRLVHAKAYIIDGKAYLGSLNFTYRGFHDNYESLIEVHDETAVRKIAAELEALPQDPAYAQADLHALGERLYKD